MKQIRLSPPGIHNREQELLVWKSIRVIEFATCKLRAVEDSREEKDTLNATARMQDQVKVFTDSFVNS